MVGYPRVDMDCIGIERDQSYVAIAEARLAWAQAQPRQLSLFA